jgi:hypothetical protein
MVKLVGNEIWRDGGKIGWLDSHHIRAHDDRKLGYFEGNFVYSEDGHKLAYIQDGHLISGNAKIALDKVSESIEGGVLSEIGKCAVYVLLGN